MHIEINQDKFCPCGGNLETFEKRPFASGIFYTCFVCGREFKKTKYIDMQSGDSFFSLRLI